MTNLTDQITRTPEGMRVWQQERMIFEVTERICELMAQEGVSRAELAQKLGKSAGHITQLLGGESNMTIRTIADLFWALGRAATVSDQTLAESTATGVTFEFNSSANWWNSAPRSWSFESLEGQSLIPRGAI